MSSGLALGSEGGRWKRYPAYKDSGVEWLGVVAFVEMHLY